MSVRKVYGHCALTIIAHRDVSTASTGWMPSWSELIRWDSHLLQKGGVARGVWPISSKLNQLSEGVTRVEHLACNFTVHRRNNS